MKFKLLRGTHSEGGVTYEPGAVFDSNSNLLELNYAPKVPRFELIPDAAPTPAPEPPKADGLDGMTVEELRQFAAESEVDLGKARTKDQILAVLRSV